MTEHFMLYRGDEVRVGDYLAGFLCPIMRIVTRGDVIELRYADHQSCAVTVGPDTGVLASRPGGAS